MPVYQRIVREELYGESEEGITLFNILSDSLIDGDDILEVFEHTVEFIKQVLKINKMNLREKIENIGIENCMFLVPMRPVKTYFGLISLTSSSDPEFIVPAKIIEERYKLKDNYKITLKSVYGEFGRTHYYISDLENLISNGTIEFFVRS